MARAAVFDQYGEPAYVSGIRVYTTISRPTRTRRTRACGTASSSTTAATATGARSVRDLPAAAGPELDEAVEEALQEREVIGELVPAVVLEASVKEVTAMVARAT
jgi:penicillin-binding protein 1A